MKLHYEIQAELDRQRSQRDAINGAIQALEWTLATRPPEPDAAEEAEEDREHVARSDC